MSTTTSPVVGLSDHSLRGPWPSPRGEGPNQGSGKDIPSPFREIIACVDGSELGDAVLPHAQAVAHVFGANLTLLRVLEGGAPVDSSPADPLDWTLRKREAQGHLDALQSRAGESEGALRSELIEGRPAEQICCWAEKQRVDLTVLCSHGTHGVSEWDLASTARKLIDRIHGSLLLIPATAEAPRQLPLRYRRILVPLDGSSRAESILPLALRIATAHDAELILLHIVPTVELTRLGALDSEDHELERRVQSRNRRVAREYLDQMRSRFSHDGLRVRAVVIGHGRPSTQLMKVVRDESVDLVVMSAHGQSGQLDSPCGSVAAYALTHTETPLLLVRDRVRRAMRRVHTGSTHRPARSDLSSGPPVP